MSIPTLEPRNVLMVLLLSALLAPAAAQASDGQLEINAACVAGGCFAGDSPGLPVEITVRGSYRLTSGLQTSDPNQTLISIDSDYVTLDLGGFSLDGPNFCQNPPAQPCNNSGTGVGIDVSATSRYVTIRDGHIQGMGSHGVYWNGGTGQIYGLNIDGSGGHGIFVGSNAVVHDNVLRRNALSGVAFGGGNHVRDNIADRNGAAGFFQGGSSTGGLVVDNTASRNGSFGISVSSETGYRGNSLAANNGDSANPQVNGGVQFGQNVCGSALCP